jgi:hypothetical protein
LNLFVRSVRQVGDCPTGISQNFFVMGINKFGKNRQGWSNLHSTLTQLIYTNCQSG